MNDEVLELTRAFRDRFCQYCGEYDPLTGSCLMAALTGRINGDSLYCTDLNEKARIVMKCQNCNGTGEEWDSFFDEDGDLDEGWVGCQKCRGTGEIEDK